VDAETGGIAADSLAPSRVGDRVFPIAKTFTDGTVLVSDEAIASTQQVLWELLRVMTEPGGAAALAALLSGAYLPAANAHVGVIIISGGNTMPASFNTRS
jgi:threonine dehydratase